MNLREKAITKELHRAVEEIVSQNAKWDCDHYRVDWYELDEDDQNKILSLMVDLTGTDFYIIGDNDESFREDILEKLVRMTKQGDTESALEFAESVKKAVRHYYEAKAIELVEEFAGYYTHERLADEGYCLVQDRNHGDFILQRI